MVQTAVQSQTSQHPGIDFFQGITSHEMLARAIRIALQLKLPEHIAQEPRKVEALAQEMGVQPAPLQRLLRALADNHLFREMSPGVFAHNANSERLRESHPHSAAALMGLTGLPCHDKAWNSMPAAMQGGKAPFEQAFGQKLYPYLAAHPDESRVFDKAMVDFTMVAVDAVARAYVGFKTKNRVLDVGGGLGQMVAGLLKHYPHLAGGVFDQPHLQSASSDYMKKQALDTRCSFVGGDFLAALPAGYDVYMVKNVLWNWGDEDVKKIMNNIAQAMQNQPGGRLMIVETLLGEGHAGWASLMDLQMYALPDGNSRSRKQFDALAQSAGLTPAEAVQANAQTTILTYKL